MKKNNHTPLKTSGTQTSTPTFSESRSAIIRGFLIAKPKMSVRRMIACFDASVPDGDAGAER